jgi:hypothetical protein
VSKGASTTYYVVIFAKSLMRGYFSYLIYSYIQRMDRGEQLLVEYGSKKLSKMIEEIKEE